MTVSVKEREALLQRVTFGLYLAVDPGHAQSSEAEGTVCVEGTVYGSTGVRHV